MNTRPNFRNYRLSNKALRNLERFAEHEDMSINGALNLLLESDFQIFRKIETVIPLQPSPLSQLDGDFDPNNW